MKRARTEYHDEFYRPRKRVNVMRMFDLSDYPIRKHSTPKQLSERIALARKFNVRLNQIQQPRRSVYSLYIAELGRSGRFISIKQKIKRCRAEKRATSRLRGTSGGSLFRDRLALVEIGARRLVHGGVLSDVSKLRGKSPAHSIPADGPPGIGQNHGRGSFKVNKMHVRIFE